MRQVHETSKNKAFLAEVRQQRRRLRIPQKLIAHEIGVSVVAYCRIERGSTDLKFDIFNFLCKRLGISGEKFLN